MRTRCPSSLRVLLCSLLASVPAAAQESVPAPAAPPVVYAPVVLAPAPAPPPELNRVRLRASVGFEGGALFVANALGFGVLGAHGLVGVQVRERFSIAATASGSFGFVSGYLRLGVQLEVHPVDVFSVSLGAEWVGFGTYLFVAASGGQAVSVPLGLHLNFGGRRAWGARSGFHLGLLGDVAFGVAGSATWAPTSSDPFATSGSRSVGVGGGFRLQLGYAFH